MNPPCMSCGGDTRKPPHNGGLASRCLHPRNHVAEKGKVWIWAGRQFVQRPKL